MKKFLVFMIMLLRASSGFSQMNFENDDSCRFIWKGFYTNELLYIIADNMEPFSNFGCTVPHTFRLYHSYFDVVRFEHMKSTYSHKKFTRNTGYSIMGADTDGGTQPYAVDSLFKSFSTTDLSEGSKLYYTDTRARTSISLTTTGTGSATYSNSTGVLNIPNLRRVEPYTGTTNSSGEITVTYATAFTNVPVVNPTIRGQTNANQLVMLTSSTTTGFTVKVVERQTDTILGIVVLQTTTANVNGATVDTSVIER